MFSPFLSFCTATTLLVARTGLVNCSVVVSTAVVRNLAVHLDNDTETVERWNVNFTFYDSVNFIAGICVSKTMCMRFLHTCSPAENSSNSHVFIYQLSGVQNLTERLQTRPLQLAFAPLRNVGKQYYLL